MCNLKKQNSDGVSTLTKILVIAGVLVTVFTLVMIHCKKCKKHMCKVCNGMENDNIVDDIDDCFCEDSDCDYCESSDEERNIDAE